MGCEREKKVYNGTFQAKNWPHLKPSVTFLWPVAIPNAPNSMMQPSYFICKDFFLKNYVRKLLDTKLHFYSSQSSMKLSSSPFQLELNDVLRSLQLFICIYSIMQPPAHGWCYIEEGCTD